ncbi:hypothetical protein PR202_ga21519 [Eleusine coracana subsp. coracana]|uniref:Reverse transcriptase zinc-binding domain-containing protein n=1 Tax=Eleusine coracana subsp. coracana TaxID=191504 RepID=A0AAV5D1P7_ELECO|nr:hypothetical protein PR202_ga21519 [Eleusine coracana subsp. coracana]
MSVIVIVGDGSSTLFWSDRWIHEKAITEVAPAIMPFVRRRGWRRRMVREALEGNSWTKDIVGGLPVLATCQYLLLADMIRDITLNPKQQDHHVWTSDPSGHFSSKSAYERYFVVGIRFERHMRLWKSWTPLKVKLFIWLMMWNRC